LKNNFKKTKILPELVTEEVLVAEVEDIVVYWRERKG